MTDVLAGLDEVAAYIRPNERISDEAVHSASAFFYQHHVTLRAALVDSERLNSVAPGSFEVEDSHGDVESVEWLIRGVPGDDVRAAIDRAIAEGRAK